MIRRGKGQLIAFDASVLKRIEELKKVKGYYPMLKEIGESYTPSHSVGFVFRALKRLSQAGMLPPEADLVYVNERTNKKGNSNGKKSKNETSDEK